MTVVPSKGWKFIRFAPFSREDQGYINRYQALSENNRYTCGYGHSMTLTRNGFLCTTPSCCGRIQEWIYEYDPTWTIEQYAHEIRSLEMLR